MYLIVGLGNPGKNYEQTRHNVGFMTIDILAERYNCPINLVKWNALVGETRINNEKVVLMKPQTFMNLSGRSVVAAAQFYKLDPSEIIVICDDVDIHFGTIRIKRKGTAGSHNGLKSIVNLLGSMDFPRVKIAVGRKHPRMDLADFVLSKFASSEIKTLQEELIAAADAVELILKEDIAEAMNVYNGWSAPSIEE